MDTKEWSRQLPPAAREALEAGLGVEAPAGARKAVWNELAAKLPAAAVTGAASGATTATLAKLFGIGLALGVATATGVTVVRHVTNETGAPATSAGMPVPFTPASAASPPRDVAAPPVEAPPRAAPAAAARGSVLPSPSSGAVSPPAPPTPAAPPGPTVAAFPADAPRAAPENAVLFESRQVARVRSLLRSGQLSSALAELAALDRSVPSGVLVQEREALRIEALLGLGDRAGARAEALRFLARHPRSPYAKGVERALR